MKFNELRLKTDFKYFCSFVGGDPVSGHEFIITPQHLELVKMLMSSARSLVVAYRGFGKSTISSLLYPIRRTTQHGKTVIIFSANEDLAVDKLRLIKTAFEINSNLQRWCGKGYTTWTDKEIWLIDREQKIVDNSNKEQYPVISRIKAMGFNSRFRGVHADIIIADDIITEENTLMADRVTPDPDKILATKRDFAAKVIPLRNPGGSIVLVGTPIYWNKEDVKGSDLLFEWLHKKNVKSFYLPALTEDGQPSCPGLHTLEYLMEQREAQDEISWLREYMLEPIIKKQGGLSEQMLADCKDINLTYVNFYTPKANETILLGADYAVIDNKQEAERKKGAYFALIAVAYDNETKIRKVLNIYYDRGLTFSEQLDMTLARINQYNVQGVCLETHGGMRYFMGELRKIIPPHIRIIDASNRKSKFDIFQGLPSLQYLFEKKLIQLAANTLEDRKKSDFLIYEMLLLENAKHVDVIDALLRVELAIRKYYEVGGYKKFDYDKYLTNKQEEKNRIDKMFVSSGVKKPTSKKQKEKVESYINDYTIEIINKFI